MHEKMSEIHEEKRQNGEMAPQPVDEAPPVSYDDYNNSPAHYNFLKNLKKTLIQNSYFLKILFMRIY